MHNWTSAEKKKKNSSEGNVTLFVVSGVKCKMSNSSGVKCI